MATKRTKPTETRSNAADATKPTRRKTAAPVAAAAPNHFDIAARAYELFLERGGAHGSDQEDWLRAEEELTAR
jgi:hypothetical protein